MGSHEFKYGVHLNAHFIPLKETERAITDLLWYCLFWKGDEQSDGARIKQLLKSIDPKLSLTPDAEKVRVVCRPNSR